MKATLIYFVGEDMRNSSDEFSEASELIEIDVSGNKDAIGEQQRSMWLELY